MSEDHRYEIKKVSDFANVPEERLEDCLSELVAFIALVRLANEQIESAGLSELLDISDTVYVWVDDGKKDVTVRLVTP